MIYILTLALLVDSKLDITAVNTNSAKKCQEHLAKMPKIIQDLANEKNKPIQFKAKCVAVKVN